MNVFVAGATGVVGRRAVSRLIAAGHRVTGLARTQEKEALLRQLGAAPARADLFAAAGLSRVVEGHDVVCNLATHIPATTRAALPGSWAENARVHREGSRNLVDAALAAGTRCYLQQSITFMYPDGGDRWIDEGWPVEPARYVRAAAEAEDQAARFGAHGGTAVVLRFGLFYAPDSEHTVAVIRLARRGVALTLGSPRGFVSSVHADDAATGILAALSVPAGTYNVVDDEPVTRRAYFDALAAALGVHPARIGPGWLRHLAGSMGEGLARSQRVSNRRFKEASGWSPRYPSVREGWQAVAAAVGRGAGHEA